LCRNKDNKKLQADDESGVCPPTYDPLNDSFTTKENTTIQEAQDKLSKLLKKQNELEKKISNLLNL